MRIGHSHRGYHLRGLTCRAIGGGGAQILVRDDAVALSDTGALGSETNSIIAPHNHLGAM
jgi:hypothetical protein